MCLASTWMEGKPWRGTIIGSTMHAKPKSAKEKKKLKSAPGFVECKYITAAWEHLSFIFYMNKANLTLLVTTMFNYLFQHRLSFLTSKKSLTDVVGISKLNRENSVGDWPYLDLLPKPTKDPMAERGNCTTQFTLLWCHSNGVWFWSRTPYINPRAFYILMSNPLQSKMTGNPAARAEVLIVRCCFWLYQSLCPTIGLHRLALVQLDLYPLLHYWEMGSPYVSSRRARLLG